MSLQLPNNCRIGKMSVYPSNWEDAGATTEIEWYIHYRFHHPRLAEQYPKGYPVHVKGMNGKKGLQERRRITRGLMKNEESNLMNGHCPVPKEILPDADFVFSISPDTVFPTALQSAYQQLKTGPTTKEIGKALPHITRAIQGVRLHLLSIKDVRQQHLEVIFLQLQKQKKLEYARQRENPTPVKKRRPSRVPKEKRPIPDEWGAAGFNHYRSYLLALFKQLKKIGATEVNPVLDVEKKKGIKPLREEITAEEMKKINTSLHANYYTFWRVIQLLSVSGARKTEFMGIQREHVRMTSMRISDCTGSS